MVEQGCLLSSCPVYPGPRVRIPPSPPTFLARLARRAWVFLILLGLLPACGGGPRESREEDILAAVQIYLRQERGLNPSAMQMEIAELSLNGDQARAVVLFHSPSLSEELRRDYLLEKQEGTWKVLGSSGEDSHGGSSGRIPEGHPPLPEQPTRDSAPAPQSG